MVCLIRRGYARIVSSNWVCLIIWVFVIIWGAGKLPGVGVGCLLGSHGGQDWFMLFGDGLVWSPGLFL